ncbi:uncharacterized protein LOC122254152 isoform X2 [Penaeus japonicus]|uniref:uncharacterized protein LOC122254152 isoform X2 n=1 Tax=Penaeus japonicus TaxID=27405 RepID=UPI001C710615|nr:uncharacterized protein LOC122254152 isoform X2 [Penaeus japonicus]
MICNSGLLITRKLKELVTGGDFSPNKRSTPVKPINLKPISTEPVQECKDLADLYQRATQPPGPGQGETGHAPDNWNAPSSYVFENPGLVCASVSEGRDFGTARFGSLTRQGRSEPEFTKINGKTVRLYSSLPRPSLSRDRRADRQSAPPIHEPPPSIAEVPPSGPPSGPPLGSQFRHHDPGLNYVALSDIYAELPRKKKKPCTSSNCSSAHHHRHHVAPPSAEVPTHAPCHKTSKRVNDDTKFSTIELPRKRFEKTKVFQKFHSLDRGWKSFVAPKANGKKYSESSVSLTVTERREIEGQDDFRSELNFSEDASVKYFPKRGSRSASSPLDQHSLEFTTFKPGEDSKRSHRRHSSPAGSRRHQDPADAHIPGARVEDWVHAQESGDRSLSPAGEGGMGEHRTARDREGSSSSGGYQCHTLPKAHREVRLCHRPSNSVRSDKVPLATWEPFFCVLLQDEHTFTSYRSEEMAIGDSLFYDLPRVRLDGGARAFRRRWGYELTPPPTLVEEENEDDPYALPNDDGDNLSYTETRSLREDYLFHSSQGKD